MAAAASGLSSLGEMIALMYPAPLEVESTAQAHGGRDRGLGGRFLRAVVRSIIGAVAMSVLLLMQSSINNYPTSHIPDESGPDVLISWSNTIIPQNWDTRAAPGECYVVWGC
jgi:hypothetical protein